MEIPYRGRAIIQDNITDLQITIPAKRNWPVMIFGCIWLCGWFAGEIAVLGICVGIIGKNPPNPFLLFWLAGWSIGGFFVIRFVWWNIAGKEIITIGQGILSVKKKGAIFYKDKAFDLKEVKNIRVQEDAASY